jgi:hypothetical protein
MVMESKRKRLTLDDYTEELLGWAFAWIRKEGVPFSERKRAQTYADEVSQKQASSGRAVVRMEKGMYLYRTTLHEFNDYFASSRMLPPPKKNKGHLKADSGVLVEALDFLTEVMPSVGEFVEDVRHRVMLNLTGTTKGPAASNPESYANLIAQLSAAHSEHIVGPKLGKVYFLKRDITIPYQDLRFKGQHGDEIAETHVKAVSIAHELAHVWILTSQDPVTLKEKNEVDPEHAFLFFSERDAKLFMKNVSAYFSEDKLKAFASGELRPFSKIDLQDTNLLAEYKKIMDKLYKDLIESENKIRIKILDIQIEMDEAKKAKKVEFKRIKTVGNYMIEGCEDQRRQSKKIAGLANLLSSMLADAMSSKSVRLKDLNAVVSVLQEEIKYYMMKYLANDKLPLEGIENKLLSALNQFTGLHRKMDDIRFDQRDSLKDSDEENTVRRRGPRFGA